MSQGVSLSVVTSPSFSMPVPEWSLYGEGHVIAGAIVQRDELNIEAQILLDGLLLYRSRHASRAVAEQELGALRGHWTGEGWVDAS
jgi:hypothetical protein